LLKNTDVRFILIGVGVLIVGISIMTAIPGIQKQQQAAKIFYNKEFVPAMVNISKLVPQNASVVVSQTHSFLDYFIGRQIIKIPADRISSEKALLNFMVKKNLRYLLVYDNRYYNPPNPLFNGTDLENSHNDFERIAQYDLDDKLRLHLYLVNNNWTKPLVNIKTPDFSEFYKKKFISSMTNLSKLVPKNESIVSSSHYGDMIYFVPNQLIIPHSAFSEKSLVSYMVHKNVTYLLVYENHSTVKGLNRLFTHEGLKNLDDDFQKLAEYTTDSHSRFHLYRLKNNWTF